MSFNGIQDYTKDFTVFNKCYFEKGELSAKGYYMLLEEKYDNYLKEGKNYLSCLLEASPYLPTTCVINIFSLLPHLIEQDKYLQDLQIILKDNINIIKVLFNKNWELADEILQVASSLNYVEAGLGANVMADLIPDLNSVPKWLKEYGLEVLDAHTYEKPLPGWLTGYSKDEEGLNNIY